MPGFEYDTITTKIDNVGQKIDSEIVDKKFESNDLNVPMDGIVASVAPVVGMFASAGVTSMALPMPGNPVNQIVFEAAGALDDAIKALQGGANVFKGAASNMVGGGIRSLLNFGRAVLPLVGQIVAVVAAFGAVAFEIWYTFDQIGQTVSHLYEAKAELEVKVGGFESKINKIEAENKALKTGIVTLEKSFKLQFQQQATKIKNLEAEVAGLETLIKENHTQSMQKLTGVEGSVNGTKTDISNLSIQSHNDFISIGTSLTSMNSVFSNKLSSIETKQTSMDEFAQSKWNLNDSWQLNNRAAVTATLTAAAIEAPERPLAQIQQSTSVTRIKLEKAVEGHPPEALGDTDYSAAIAGGTAVAAGTVGYAAWKTANGGFKDMKNKMSKLGSMIDVGRIMDVITLILTLHNAAMLSRNLFETCIRVVDNGLNATLNAFGIKDINDEGVDSKKAFQATFDTIGKQIFGVQSWTEIKGTWAKFNRIVTTGNTLLWSVRDLFDNTQNLAELAAENSAKVGNLLRRAGAIYDRGPWFPENYNHRTVLHRKMAQLEQFFQNANNTAQIFEEFTETTLEIQENIKEIKDNNDAFQKALKESPKKETTENDTVKTEATASKTASASVEIPKEQLSLTPTQSAPTEG